MRNSPNENYDLTQEPEPIYPATIMFGPSHVPVLKNNFSIAEQTGHVAFFFAMPVKKLLRDSKTGRVTGVIAVADDGTVIEAHAKKAVILTTGDYTGNPEILKTYFPQFVDNPQIPCGMDPHKKPATTWAVPWALRHGCYAMILSTMTSGQSTEYNNLIELGHEGADQYTDRLSVIQSMIDEQYFFAPL